MVTSIIKKSELEGAKRIDAEYYQPRYLELKTNLLKTKSYKQWGNLEGRFITGPFGSQFIVENYSEEKEYRYIRGRDIKDFFLAHDDNAYIPKKDYERLKKYSVQTGDVLVSVVGTLGNSVVVDDSVPPAIFSSKSTVFRPQEIDAYYLIAYLNSKFGKGFLERNVRGAVQTGLNLDDLKDLPIFIPSVVEQNRIASIIIESKQTADSSEGFYTKAEELLLKELGLQESDFEDELSYVVNAWEIAKRSDAEYFQPKYEKLLQKIGKNAKKLCELAPRQAVQVGLNKDRAYNYIEISDISANSGEADYHMVEARELPANAKMKIDGGELIISKVRPTRGAISIIPDDWQNDFVASGAFSIFKLQSPMREYVQVVLRSFIGKLQLERPTTGTSYPTIMDKDVENVVIPILPKATQQKIGDLVQESHTARKKSKDLLNQAKHQVEELIEKGEK